MIRHFITPASKFLICALLACGLIAGCGFQTYSPKPIDPAQNLARYQARNVNSPEFRDYLLSQGYTENQLPITEWGLRGLTLSALFFHDELDVARAKWRAAQAAEITAGQRQTPGISGNLEHHDDTPGGISPWTYTLGIDIPIETGNKRQARIDQAMGLSEAARIEIAQTAWRVRSRLASSLIDYSASLQQTQVLEQDVALRSDIVSMLQARLDVGLISNIEISSARLQLQKSRQALEAEKGRTPLLLAALASNAGLSVTAFSGLNVVTSTSPSIADPLDDFQQTALLNRLDIRSALARYNAAEAKLRLEIANQYPDVTLSPGYSFDQGDRIWLLGLSTLLTLLKDHKNEGLIAEARALREVEAAQFEALQVKVIDDVIQSKAGYYGALDELEKAKQLQASQLGRLQQAQRQFDAGFADRLELATIKLENLVSSQSVLDAQYKLERAALAFEDAIQRPLDNSGFPTAPEQKDVLQ